MRTDRERLAQGAVAQHLDAVFDAVYHPSLDQQFGRDDRTGLEDAQVTQINDGVLSPNDGLVADATSLPDRTALLGHAPVKRGLAAFKAKFRRATCLVALVAATGARTMAGARATADDLAPVRGSLSGPQIRKVHY